MTGRSWAGAGHGHHLRRHDLPPRPKAHRDLPETLERIGQIWVRPPERCTPPSFKALMERGRHGRDGRRSTGRMGELLAFGSLLMEGTPGAPGGQDSRRGTFVQRHAVAHRQADGPGVDAAAVPGKGQARFWIYDSLLSEYAAMGFEYGYSVERPDALVLLGGPVRRLRQRRADHHRRVHLLRRAEVGHSARPSCCCCRTATRARGPTTRSARIERFLAAVRRGQHDRRLAVDPGVVLPPAAPPGLHRPRRPLVVFTPEVDAAPQGGRLDTQDFTTGQVRAGGGRRKAAARAGGHPGALCYRQGHPRLSRPSAPSARMARP